MSIDCGEDGFMATNTFVPLSCERTATFHVSLQLRLYLVPSLLL